MQQNNATWVERESQSAFNTAVAATASELPITGTIAVPANNFLFVQNRDITPIQIRLDGMTTNGRVFEVQANGGIFVLDPANGDDVNFKFFISVNLDAANAQTAGLILYRVAYKERI